MIGLQPGHVIIIIFVALIFLAPSRIPMVVRGFRKMFSEIRDEATGKKAQDQETDAKNVSAAPKK